MKKHRWIVTVINVTPGHQEWYTREDEALKDYRKQVKKWSKAFGSVGEGVEYANDQGFNCKSHCWPNSPIGVFLDQVEYTQ